MTVVRNITHEPTCSRDVVIYMDSHNAHNADNNAEDSSPGQSLSGSIVGRQIEILHVVARGATSTLYKATHLDMNRNVAVKILDAHLLGDQESRERFRREGVVSASLDHPGIVRVYSSGFTDEGAPYIVMDLLDGQSLAGILKQSGRLTLEQFFTYFEQILEALEYSHSHNVLHRDLKPSNIMIINEGGFQRVKLIDFGIAKLIAEVREQAMTRTGAVIGTSLYMSPEQCAGQPLDIRTDIYSIGCVMYEALVGEPPFEGDSPLEVMYKQLHSSVPKAGLRKIPGSLDRIITRCLEKSPDQRFESAGELLKQLRDCNKSLRTTPKALKQLALAAIAIGLTIYILGHFAVTGKEPVATNSVINGDSSARFVPAGYPALEARVGTLDKQDKPEGERNREILGTLRDWLRRHEHDGHTPKEDIASAASLLVIYAMRARLFDEADAMSALAVGYSPNALLKAERRLRRSQILPLILRTSKAMDEVRTAVEELKAVPPGPAITRALSQGYHQMGVLYSSEGVSTRADAAAAFAAAYECFAKERRLLEEVGDETTKMAGYCVNSMALVAALQGNQQLAMRHVLAVATVAQSLDHREKAWLLVQGAETCELIGDFRKALNLRQEALAALGPDGDAVERTINLIHVASDLRVLADDRGAAQAEATVLHLLNQRKSVFPMVPDRVVAAQRTYLSHPPATRCRYFARELLMLYLKKPDFLTPVQLFLVADAGLICEDAQNQPSREYRLVLDCVKAANSASARAACLLALGAHSQRQNDHLAAEECFRRAISERPPEADILARTKHCLGVLMYERCNYKESEILLQEALSLYGPLVGVEAEKAGVLLYLALAQSSMEKPEASDTRHRASKAANSIAGLGQGFLLAYVFTHLSGTKEHCLEGLELIEERLAFLDRLARPDHERMPTLAFKAVYLQNLGRVRDADEIIASVTSWGERSWRDYPLEVCQINSLIASCKRANGDMAGAIEYLKKAIKASQLGSDQFARIPPSIELARCYRSTGQFDLAERELRAAIASLENLRHARATFVKEGALAELGELYVERGRFPDAINALRNASAAAAQLGGDMKGERARILYRLGDAYNRNSNFRDAVAAYQECADIRPSIDSSNPSLARKALMKALDICTEKQMTAEASRLRQRLASL